MTECGLCTAREEARLVYQTNLSYVVIDKFPQTSGHCLVLPKRCVTKIDDLTLEEHQDLNNLAAKVQRDISKNKRVQVLWLKNGQYTTTQPQHLHYHLIPLPSKKEVYLVDEYINSPGGWELTNEGTSLVNVWRYEYNKAGLIFPNPQTQTYENMPLKTHQEMNCLVNQLQMKMEGELGVSVLWYTEVGTAFKHFLISTPHRDYGVRNPLSVELGISEKTQKTSEELTQMGAEIRGLLG